MKNIKLLFLFGVFAFIFISKNTVSAYSYEVARAYDFGYTNKLTTMETLDKFMPYGNLERGASWKFLYAYLHNFLKITDKPDVGKCDDYFVDFDYVQNAKDTQGLTFQDYLKEVCEYGLVKGSLINGRRYADSKGIMTIGQMYAMVGRIVDLVNGNKNLYNQEVKDGGFKVYENFFFNDVNYTETDGTQQNVVHKLGFMNNKGTRFDMVEILRRLSYVDIKAVSTEIITPTPSTTDGKTPTIGQCNVFPADNAWNTNISSYPVHEKSDAYVNTILAGGKYLHPDFGANRDGGPFGIPYIEVNGGTPLVSVKATWYPDESDQGNFPVPLNAPIEKGSDHHVIAVDGQNCKLYELYAAEQVGGGWEAGSVATFDLNSNALRPDGRTSADAAGLAIFPGLARYDEVANGEINHALRFTISKTQKAYVYPATHYASSITDTNYPPMGARFRLKASYDISWMTGQSKVIAQALKKYGMIVADNGSNWFISGAPDSRRDDDDLNQLKQVPGSAFEVVDFGR